MMRNSISEHLNFLEFIINRALSKSGRSIRKNLQKIHTSTPIRNAIE